jgi:Flp pilus assembly pilin Flp
LDNAGEMFVVKDKISLIIKRFREFNKGQGILEYGFIIVLIAMAVLVALGALGQHVFDFFNTLPNKFP